MKNTILFRVGIVSLVLVCVAACGRKDQGQAGPSAQGPASAAPAPAPPVEPAKAVPTPPPAPPPSPAPAPPAPAPTPPPAPPATAEADAAPAAPAAPTPYANAAAEKLALSDAQTAAVRGGGEAGWNVVKAMDYRDYATQVKDADWDGVPAGEYTTAPLRWVPAEGVELLIVLQSSNIAASEEVASNFDVQQIPVMSLGVFRVEGGRTVRIADVKQEGPSPCCGGGIVLIPDAQAPAFVLVDVAVSEEEQQMLPIRGGRLHYGADGAVTVERVTFRRAQAGGTEDQL